MRKVAPALAIALLLTLLVAPVGAGQTIEISISPTADNVRRGSERFKTLDPWVEPIGGYSKSVTVGAEDVPPGANVSFDGYPTKSGMPPFSSEVVVSVPLEVALGEYNIVFKAVGEDGATDSMSYRLRVEEEYIPKEEKEEIGVPIHVWAGAAAVVVAVILLVVYLRIRARREWAPAPPAPAPPAPAPPAS